jgi:tetratricopeptide (TPR) repeat protein
MVAMALAATFLRSVPSRPEKCNMLWQLILTLGLLAADPASSTTLPLGPADLPALARKAETNYLVRDWPDSIAQHQKLVELNPTNGFYWYRLGDSLLNTQRYREAIEPLKQAMALGGFQSSPPKWIHRGEAAFLLAAAYAGLGDKPKAVEATRTSLKQGLRGVRRFHGKQFASLQSDPEFRTLVWADVDDVKSLSRDDAFRRDVKFAVSELKRVHYSPFRATPEAEIDRQVAALDADIPQLSDDEIYVRLMTIIRGFGDAHTRMLRDTPQLPVALFLYPEGLHVLGAAKEHADLVGAKVLSIGGHPVDEALQKAMAIVPVENPMTERWEAAGALRSVTILRGLGLTPPEGPVELEIEDATGQMRKISLTPPEKRPARGDYVFAIPGCTTPLPNCLRNRSEMMWHELLPDGKTMYCQLNGIGHGKQSFQRYFEKLFAEIESSPVERLILDLRWNGGGNTFLNPVLIEGIQRSAKFRQPGNFFVIIGRNTFSAALNTTDELERRTTAILVGEPTSSPPNFIGESVEVVLPASRWPISISDLSWQTSYPMDYRAWMTPLIYAPPTAAALRAHRDPAMEAIQTYLERNPEKRGHH